MLRVPLIAAQLATSGLCSRCLGDGVLFVPGAESDPAMFLARAVRGIWRTSKRASVWGGQGADVCVLILFWMFP